jgi:ankyrin repeat protein
LNVKTLKLIFKNTCLFVFLAFLSFSNVKAQESSIFDVARNGSLMEIKALTNNNPDIINNLSKEGYSVLTLACYYSNNEVASYLIEHVKDVNSKSGYGTPLMAATVKKNSYLVKLLLENNANPNLTDSTALHFSVIFNQQEIIELLMKYKANPNIKDNRGNTALDYAKITNNSNIIQLLK